MWRKSNKTLDEAIEKVQNYYKMRVKRGKYIPKRE